MAKIFKSKIGIGLIILLSTSMGIPTIMFLIQGIWLGLLLMLIVIFFIVNLFTTTDYTINADNLIIRSGFLFKKVISIESIRKIEESGSLMSAPALSLDRLELFYNKFDSVLVSPKSKSEFIEHLQRINDKIEMKTRAISQNYD